MKKRRSREGIRDVPEINITPLVDLTFVLLIVFMIIAPAMEQAIGVNTPPKVSATVIPDDTRKVININRNGDITYDSRVIDIQTLTASLASARASNPEVRFYLRADETRTYGEVMGVMRAARKAGIDNVALVTLPEDN